ncbi:hypothetical protein N9M75_02115 [Schleiferiaceae bacterium]|nr:hypothetical protein [Schleiferiaceae bacterium]
MVNNKLKIGAIIQARFDSTRLPGKVFFKLPFQSNDTVLDRIINRIKLVKGLIPIIATSTEASDNSIFEFAKSKNISVFRGEKENVLNRFFLAAKEYDLDIILRITGDNPIVLTEVIQIAIKNHLKSGAEYSRNNGLPYGTSFEIINFTTLKKVNEEATSNEEKEHVTLYIKNNKKLFKILENDFSYLSLKSEKVRLTVDYPTDYALLNLIFQDQKMQSDQYTFETLKLLFDSNEWLPQINNHNFQKQQFNSIEEEMIFAKETLKQLDLWNALKILDNQT